MTSTTFTVDAGPETINVVAVPSAPLPIRLDFNAQHPDDPDTGPFHLDREEAQALLEALEAALEFDGRIYVQVKFAGQSRYGTKTYTYIDPFGDLTEGDLVDVPTKYDDHNVATVVALGKGEYRGFDPRTVTARYSREVAA